MGILVSYLISTFLVHSAGLRSFKPRKTHGLKKTYGISARVLVEVGESTSETVLTLGTNNEVLGILVDDDDPENAKTNKFAKVSQFLPGSGLI